MYFTLKQLRYYDAALRTGSIVKASAEMNISQSSITAALDAIEQSVGQELFRRVPAKGLQPTDAGRRVGMRIADFLDQARIFESDLMSISGDLTGTLHVGCYAPSAPHVLPRLMKILAQAYPAVRVDLVETDLAAMVQLLQNGRIDLALTYRRTMPDTLPFMPMFEARPYALLPESSPYAQADEVTLAQLATKPLIMLDLPTTVEYFAAVFSQYGLKFQIAHTTKSSSVLRGLVAAGFGHSVLNICSPSDRQGTNGYVCRPISGALHTPEFGVAYTNASRRSSIVQAVLDICEKMAQSQAFDDLVLRPAGESKTIKW